MNWRLEAVYQCEVRKGEVWGTWKGDKSYDDTYEGIQGMIADVKKFLKEPYAEVDLNSREWDSWRKVERIQLRNFSKWEGDKNKQYFSVRYVDADGYSVKRVSEVALTEKNVKQYIEEVLAEHRTTVREEQEREREREKEREQSIA